MIRWSMIVIAVAPPSQSALTTAWRSCWCTTSVSPGGVPSWIARSSTSWGASLSVTVTPGPDTGARPDGPRRVSILRCSRVTVRLDLARERVDLGVERRHPGLQGVGVGALAADQRAQVGDAGRPQVAALGVQRLATNRPPASANALAYEVVVLEGAAVRVKRLSRGKDDRVVPALSVGELHAVALAEGAAARVGAGCGGGHNGQV